MNKNVSIASSYAQLALASTRQSGVRVAITLQVFIAARTKPMSKCTETNIKVQLPRLLYRRNKAVCFVKA